MKKTVEELSDDELKAELLEREKKRKAAADRAVKKAAKEAEKKISRIEKLYKEATDAHRKELQALDKEERALERKRIEIAEKYGIPTYCGKGDQYIPVSVTKWEDEEAFTPEELEWVGCNLEWFSGYGEVEPGEYWQPSQYC